MGKVSAFILITAFRCIGCSVSLDRSGAGKPYSDRQFDSYEDLYDRGVPTDDFSATSFALASEDTIEIRFYTKARPGDEKMIDPSIKKIEYLTEKLRKRYKVKVMYYDGNPNVTINDQPQGTGSVLRTVELPTL